MNLERLGRRDGETGGVWRARYQRAAAAAAAAAGRRGLSPAASHRRAPRVARATQTRRTDRLAPQLLFQNNRKTPTPNSVTTLIHNARSL
ncbi:unnamed protein product [Plutella xylostella]|uniref:(diamondback moth) hypothetical protein n=1 Tax=Plutella xylostella TaxID=51655 RepID=A0A8S4E8K5_PLUXY|nr:unnamed protein product [Plutella xylostella]